MMDNILTALGLVTLVVFVAFGMLQLLDWVSRPGITKHNRRIR